MTRLFNRRNFLKKAVFSSTVLSVGWSFEERALLGRSVTEELPGEHSQSTQEIPMGKIGSLEISRLICGGNLFSGFAHSRDLIYVSGVLRQYFSDDKIIITLRKCEQQGINTTILRLDDQILRIVNRYREAEGGNIQWIVQIKPSQYDMDNFRRDIDLAIANGAVGAYIQGGVGDKLVQDGKTDLIEEVVEYVRNQGVISGIGAHSIRVPIACERAGISTDFYMKTVHHPEYWTFNPEGEPMDDFYVTSGESHDNVWCADPEQTIEFMESVNKPWIGFKVLAAGAIHPKEGFQYAFENGADFICAGMFDFHVNEDVAITREILGNGVSRRRQWCG
jgi:hypothetical protein